MGASVKVCKRSPFTETQSAEGTPLLAKLLLREGTRLPLNPILAPDLVNALCLNDHTAVCVIHPL